MKDNRWHKAGTDLDRIKYGYDRASNRIWRKNPIATAHSAQYDWLYTYDGLQRLKTAHRGTLNGTQTALASTAFKQDWNLDPTGNWEGFKQSDNGSTWSIEQERTANPVNEITDITNTVGSAWADPAYNAVGNMTTIPKPKQMDEAYTATYDAWNRLVKLEEEVSSTLETVAEYQYDARNFRVVVKNYNSGALDETTHAYFTDAWQCVEELKGVLEGTNSHFVWGARYLDDLILRDRSIISDEPPAVRHYSLQEDNWNTSVVVAADGVVHARYEYDAYGMATFLDDAFSLTGNILEWETLYAGYRFDTNTSLYCVRYRQLHVLIGWLVRDPHILDEGNNLYSYVSGRPLALIDPLGLAGCNMGAAFGEALFQVLSVKIAALVGKRALKAGARSAILLAADGPLPIGDIIAAAWLAWDVYSGLREIQALKKMWEFLESQLKPELSELWSSNNFSDCLERNGQCCKMAKDLVRDSVNDVGGFSAIGKSVYKRAGEVVRNIRSTLPKIAACCIPKTPKSLTCYRSGTTGFNKPDGSYWTYNRPDTIPNFNERYGIPAGNSTPDWTVSAEIPRKKFRIQPAEKAEDNPIGRPGGWPEIYVEDPSGLEIHRVD
ncbi:hypothetical protein Plim_1600 [Planctopirus limnophila DSM 3776]|uniref:YD repeat protein n=1 Tax=Planctopirus limnophila (strain ATCC 43296 / DSM 3776 / IFAM 1008 / Mu 290) TaxID=521674 RepID=D5SWT3_PLAL2|nr:RHS repeat-associated core domain-containing protein [Planctopirus limnophila]ADG67433.1 hypothetical protein Plim_1600 [Planctopirus limnophila DSM 3776]